MHKKAVVFIWISGFIFLVALYGQLLLMNNDVKTYVRQSQHTFSPDTVKTKYRVIPIDVREASTVYISYKGEVQGTGHTFKILDMNNNELINETGKNIHIFKEKLQLEKGRYQIVIDIDHIEHIKSEYSFVYRKEDVALVFPQISGED